MKLTAQILDLLRQSGGMTIAQIKDALPEPGPDLSKTLSNAKYRGSIVAERDGGELIYRAAVAVAASDVAAKRASAPKVAPSKHVAKPEHPAPQPVRIETTDATLTALARSANAAQEALDAYIAAVADTDTYDGLCEAVNNARDAIHRYTLRRSQPEARHADRA